MAVDENVKILFKTFCHEIMCFVAKPDNNPSGKKKYALPEAIYRPVEALTLFLSFHTLRYSF